MSDWYARTQEATKANADANGLPWTSEDVDLVIAFTDDVTDEDIALATGRTLAAVWNIQHRVRTEGVVAVRRAYAPSLTAPAPRVCATHAITLTAMGTCDWCD